MLYLYIKELIDNNQLKTKINKFTADARVYCIQCIA